MNEATYPRLLRLSLLSNAVFSGLSGLILVGAAASVADVMGAASPWVLRGIGAMLLLFAFDLFSATRKPPRPARVGYFIVMDAAWVVGTAVALWGLALPFTEAGRWILLLIADVVAVFAVLQTLGLRRLRRVVPNPKPVM